jgi:HEPN domain-containing protein
MQSDKYINDAKTWCAQGETFGRAAVLLFRSDPFLYFPAAILGHQALEMLLKAALIRQGFKITRVDGGVWGHDLVELATKLESVVATAFSDELFEAAEIFTDYFNELRYPRELKNVEGLGGEEGLRLEYAIGYLLSYARPPKDAGT